MKLLTLQRYDAGYAAVASAIARYKRMLAGCGEGPARTRELRCVAVAALRHEAMVRDFQREAPAACPLPESTSTGWQTEPQG